MGLGFCLLLALTASIVVNASPEDPFADKEFEDCYNNKCKLGSGSVYVCMEGKRSFTAGPCYVECFNQVYPDNPTKAEICGPGTWEYCIKNSCTVEENTFLAGSFACPKNFSEFKNFDGTFVFSDICGLKCDTGTYRKDVEYIICKRKDYANLNECRLCDPLPQ